MSKSTELLEAAVADVIANHLTEQTCDALLSEYVDHLRTVGIAQLKRKAQTSRPVAKRCERSSALPKYVHSRTPQIDPEELRKLEERIERDCDIVRRHLFGWGSQDAEADAGLTRERIRQITRRAAKMMGEMVGENPRFAELPTRGVESRRSDQSTTLLPEGNHVPGQDNLVTVTEPDLVPSGTNPDLSYRRHAGNTVRH
ncbi:MAG: hypothetical protein R3E04_04050 [Sphingobium sp.]